MLGKLVITLTLSSVARSTLIDLKTAALTGRGILQSWSFDYVVVGGGTAGLTVARRLSENAAKKVLVLEAGRSGVGDPLVTIPQNSYSFLGTDIDWLYSTIPQTNAAGQRINLSSGKVLGGDSAVNGLVWVRGPTKEYDAIEDLGNPGWNWKTFSKAMRKAEKLNLPSQELVDEFGFTVKPTSLGSGGPVDVSFPAFLPLQHQKFINASVQLGHRFNKDPYNGNNEGVFYSLSSQTSRAVRETSEFAYLDPVLNRTNLIVLSHAVVTQLKLVTAGTNRYSSTGVWVRFPDGSITFARAKVTGGEVILAAGTIRTPQLLELSGIGDKNILKPLGISVKLDLPGVGTNYEDHTLTILTYKLKEPYLSFDAFGYVPGLKEEQQELYKQGKGWLTFANSVLNMAPLDRILNVTERRVAKTILETKPPTISNHLFKSIKGDIFSGVPQVEYLLFNSFSGGTVKEANRSYVSMAITHLHPLSRGSIHINTTSIDDHPLINPNLLESEWDKWVLAKATAYGRKFFQTPTFQEIFEQEEVFPGPNVTTDAQWEQFVKDTVGAGYHSVGTASLLPKAQNGVVDTKLKVYGSTNIRVVDLSVLSLLLSAHTQPAAYAIVEMAADILKAVW